VRQARSASAAARSVEPTTSLKNTVAITRSSSPSVSRTLSMNSSMASSGVRQSPAISMWSFPGSSRIVAFGSMPAVSRRARDPDRHATMAST